MDPEYGNLSLNPLTKTQEFMEQIQQPTPPERAS